MSALKQHKEDRKRIQGEIISLPASLFPKEFQDFVLRGEEHEVISWNEKMIFDEGLPFERLLQLKVLTERRLELYNEGNF